MNKKIAIVVAGIVALVVSGLVAADRLAACDAAKTAQANHCSRDAAYLTAVAAEVTAGKEDCCKSAVASFIASCNGTVTQTAKTEGSSCSARNKLVTASAGSCESSYAAVTAGMKDCCKETVHEFMVRVGCPAAAMAGSASSCCAKSAMTTASARTSCSKQSQVAWGGKCTRSTASAAEVAISDLPYRKGEEVVLTGSAVCGNCNLKITDTCTSLFQTADGTVYRVYRTDKTRDMRQASEKNDIKIFATVRDYEGTKVLDVRSFVAL